jgi:hypothetical protein
MERGLIVSVFKNIRKLSPLAIRLSGCPYRPGFSGDDVYRGLQATQAQGFGKRIDDAERQWNGPNKPVLHDETKDRLEQPVQ